jgi:hypothetical protein
VLVATTPTRTIIDVIGIALVVMGLVLTAALWRRHLPVIALIVVLAAGGFTWGVTSAEPCQVESAYYCMRVEHDPFRADGRILWLDNVRHSYVDLADPEHLEFDYTRSFADAVNTAFPATRPLDALHIGGGGFTFPRYLAATRPGSRSTVLEIDPAVLDLGRDELGLHTSRALQVRIGDARLGIRDEPDDSRDLVVGDAFGSLSVPWHLTRRSASHARSSRPCASGSSTSSRSRPGRSSTTKRARTWCWSRRTARLIPPGFGGWRRCTATSSSTAPRSTGSSTVRR